MNHTLNAFISPHRL